MYEVLFFNVCSSYFLFLFVFLDTLRNKEKETGKQGDAGRPRDRYIWGGRKRSLEPSGDISICKINVCTSSLYGIYNLINKIFSLYTVKEISEKLDKLAKSTILKYHSLSKERLGYYC